MTLADPTLCLAIFRFQNGKSIDAPGEIGAWCFTVIEADERRIISAKAEPVLPSLTIASQEPDGLDIEALAPSEQTP